MIVIECDPLEVTTSPRVTTVTRHCVVCDKPFGVKSPRSKRVYCNQRCNNAAWLKRKAEQA